MPLLAEDFARWSNRAEEARAIAGQFREPEARRIMLEIAKGYERLVRRAEELVATSPNEEAPPVRAGHGRHA